MYDAREKRTRWFKYRIRKRSTQTVIVAWAGKENNNLRSVCGDLKLKESQCRYTLLHVGRYATLSGVHLDQIAPQEGA